MGSELVIKNLHANIEGKPIFMPILKVNQSYVVWTWSSDRVKSMR